MRQHYWKEHLNISTVAKFERDLLKSNKDIAPQRSKILQMFVWWGPHHINVCKFLQLWGAISLLA